MPIMLKLWIHRNSVWVWVNVYRCGMLAYRTKLLEGKKLSMEGGSNQPSLWEAGGEQHTALKSGHSSTAPPDHSGPMDRPGSCWGAGPNFLCSLQRTPPPAGKHTQWLPLPTPPMGLQTGRLVSPGPSIKRCISLNAQFNRVIEYSKLGLVSSSRYRYTRPG